MENILFVCTNNIERSAAAHVILAREGSGQYRVDSAGTAKRPPRNGKITPLTQEALVSLGYNPSYHKAKLLSEELVVWATKIVCMAPIHEKHISYYYPEHSNKIIVWDIPEAHPGEEGLSSYEICQRLRNRIIESFL